MGHDIKGSDLKYSPGLDQLKSKGINVTIGHSTSNFDNPKILTKSTAIPEGNPEVVAALEAGVPVLTRAQIMAAITAKKKSIVVAGTHGKTTTSSILSVLLSAAGTEPSFLIKKIIKREPEIFNHLKVYLCNRNSKKSLPFF